MDFVGEDERTVFEPGRVEFQHADGELIEGRDNPQTSFEGQRRDPVG